MQVWLRTRCLSFQKSWTCWKFRKRDYNETGQLGKEEVWRRGDKWEWELLGKSDRWNERQPSIALLEIQMHSCLIFLLNVRLILPQGAITFLLPYFSFFSPHAFLIPLPSSITTICLKLHEFKTMEYFQNSWNLFSLHFFQKIIKWKEQVYLV